MSIKRFLVIVLFATAGFYSTCVLVDRGFLVNLLKPEVDFACYYSAALAARWGAPMHNSGPYPLLKPNVLRDTWKSEDGAHAKPENVYLYPALLAYILVPLTFLPFKTAEVLWNLSCLLAYGIGVWVFIRSIRLTGFQSGVWEIAWVFLSMIWPPFLIAVQHGQVVPWIFLFLSLTVWAVLTERDFLAAGALGLAAGLKLGPVVYVAWLLVLRRLRTAGMALIVFLILLCVGPTHNVRLFRWVLPHVRLGSTLESNQCLNGVLCRAVSENRERWITPESLTEIRGAIRLAAGLGAIAACLVLFVTFRSGSKPQTIVASFSLVALTLALFSPLSRVTEYTYALFAMGYIGNRWLESGRLGRIVLGMAGGVVFGLAVLNFAGILHRFLETPWTGWISVNATFLWGMILWIVLAADSLKPHHAS